MRRLLPFTFLLLFAPTVFAQAPVPDCKNPKLPIPQRVHDLWA